MTNGIALGTLCIIDTKPRRITADEVADLNDLAAIAENEFNVMSWTLRIEDTVEKIAGRIPQDAQNVLAAIVKSSNDAIIAKDMDSRITSWNPAAQALFGYRASEMIGKHVTKLFPSERMKEELAIMAQVKSGQIVDSFDTVRIRKDGTPIHVSITVSPILNEEGAIIGASKICRDISERKKMEKRQEILAANLDSKVAALIESEEALKHLNNDLERQVCERVRQFETANRELAESVRKLTLAQNELISQERLSSLGAMVAGISHELNTPIGNALLLASTMKENSAELLAMLDQPKLQKTQFVDLLNKEQEMTELTLKSIRTAAELIQSFKQIAVDQTSEHRRSFNLRQVVTDIITTILIAHKHDFTRTEINNHIPNDIVCDSYPGPLGQIVTNLLQNAIVHGFDGRPHGMVDIHCITPDSTTLQLSICDDGVGIAPAVLGHIFDPFYTTKLGKGGSGLGLAVSNRIATTVLGGKIDVRSRFGEGAIFTVTIPRSAPFKMC